MESIPDSVVQFVLDSLKQIGMHYYELLSGTEDKINELKKQLVTLKGFIDDFTKQHISKALQALVTDIRGVISEAETAIDSYEVTASKQENRNLPSKTVHFPGYVLDLEDVADRIQKISMRVQDFFQNRAKLILDMGRPDEIPKQDPRKTQASAVVTKDSTVMVGLKDEVEKVVELLHKKKEKLEVVSIVGMPGLGKTKLAAKVKDHSRVEFTFSPRAFVRVSNEYKKREVFLNMLRALEPTHGEMNDMSDEELKVAIHEELKDKLYMIVMDDVWTEDDWDELKEAFPDNKGSKVLLTSRNFKVAHHANRSKDSVVHLRHLDPDESKELLRREVFGEEGFPPELDNKEKLEKYEEEIVSKCGNLPLSIMVIAGMLLPNRESTDMWKDVAESVHSYVGNNEKLSNLIGLSYNNLPDHLKHCFLYLGMFHGGSRIPAWKLLQLWIAEGFVEREGDTRLEVTAKRYLEDLVSRNLVRVEERRTNGQIKTCCLHDTVRDFCTNEAEKLNLFREINVRAEASSSSSAAKDYCRGLCIHSHFKQYMCTKPSHKYVRSFLSFSQEAASTDRISEEVATSFAKGFKLLRVLDARSIIFPNFPNELLCLLLLRYMSISFDSNTLPGGVSDLGYLQTLIVRKSQGPLNIKADLWKMSELRHLHTNVSTSLYCPAAKGPFEEYKISPNIQTLSRISSDSCRADVLERTPNIKKLGICGKIESSLFESLSDLEDLEDLRLFNESQMCTFPATSKNFPKKLTKLTLRNTSLDWGYMSVLAALENLEVLKLKDNAFQGDTWGSMKIHFSSLHLLHIGIKKLEGWQATVNNFPVLRCLIIKDCKKLKGIPSDIGRIKSLQNVSLHNTNKYLAQAALKIKESKRNLNMHFYLSVLPEYHLHSESTNDDEHSDEEVIEEPVPRVEALPKIAVPENSKAPKVPFFKRIFHRSSGSGGKNPKSKNKG